MKVAFLSPLNPQKSGISDYTEELLPQLASQADIDLFVDGFEPANGALLQSFRWFDYQREPTILRTLSNYDAVVYHMGNDPRYHSGIYEIMCAHPGIVVFHDFAYQFFFFYLAYERRQTRIYLEEIQACHGAAERAQAEAALEEGRKPPHVAQPLSFPLNFRLAQAAEAIIVHSEWSRSRFEQIVPSTPVAHINMHTVPFTTKPPSFDNGKDSLVQIAAFGHATSEKGIERILNALAWLKLKGYRFHFTLVGEVSLYFNVEELIRERGLKHEVTTTGYVTLEDLKRRCASTDIAINLRENYVGETSASLLRLMAAGVPTIVTDVGWFAELPDDAVIKIDAIEGTDALLRAYLERLLVDPNLRLQIGANARRHALARHSVTDTANAYVSFIRDVVGARMRKRFVKGVARELSLLGVGERDEELLAAIATSVATIAPPAKFRTGNGDRPPPDLPSQIGPLADEAAPPSVSVSPKHNGRLRKLDDIDYKLAAREYLGKLDQGRRQYLLTKPFDNLATRPPKYQGDGLDAETHRLFCDFANIVRQLALAPGSRVLDVGCGSGWLSEYFARLGYDALGIDISPELIDMARDRLRRVPYALDSATTLSCRFQTHDIEHAPLSETFDAIVCYDSLHHFEDERAAIRNISDMVNYGGLLFILEGDRPAEGSAGEAELIDTMREFGTLESPFDRDYLFELLQENGFVVTGDYVSVNGFFHRELVAENQVAIEPPTITYLLCKKVAQPGTPALLRDSRQPLGLNARLSSIDLWPASVAAGTQLKVTLTVENTGDALWRVGPTALKGSVMLGIKILNEAGQLVFESHGSPAITRALAPGERANIELSLEMPNQPGKYELKIDLVAQHVCWFEQVGSTPLVLPLKVI